MKFTVFIILVVDVWFFNSPRVEFSHLGRIDGIKII